MIKTNDDPNDHMAFPTWNPYWDQNIVNGEYVIAYELDYSLHQKLQNMLPKVYLLFRSDRLRSVRG